MIATLVDTKALFKVVWVSLAGGVGMSLAYSLVVFGVARAGDLRRQERGVAAVGYAALAVAGLAACVWALVRGYLLLIQKS